MKTYIHEDYLGMRTTTSLLVFQENSESEHIILVDGNELQFFSDRTAGQGEFASHLRSLVPASASRLIASSPRFSQMPRN
jgi:hypothetical protein